jgi:hypothetical protein
VKVCNAKRSAIESKKIWHEKRHGPSGGFSVLHRVHRRIVQTDRHQQSRGQYLGTAKLNDILEKRRPNWLSFPLSHAAAVFPCAAMTPAELTGLRASLILGVRLQGNFSPVHT